MSINKVQLKPESQLIRTVKQQSRFIRELKTPQAIGGDLLKVMNLPSAYGNYEQTFTLTSGSSVNFALAINPTLTVETLCNYQVTLYVDSLSNGQFGGWYGSSLTAGQLNFQWVHWLDLADTGQISPFDIDQKVIKSFIKNNDTASHTYYLQYQLQIPYVEGATASTSS